MKRLRVGTSSGKDGEIPNWFFNFTNLTNLHISFDSEKATYSDYDFSVFKQLKVLYIRATNVNKLQLVPKSIFTLQDLSYLRIVGFKIPEEVSGLKELHTFYGKNIELECPKSLFLLPKITNLEYYPIKFTESTLDGISMLNKSLKLFHTNNPIGKISEEIFLLSNIEILILTIFNGFIPEEIMKLKNLTYLRLFNGIVYADQTDLISFIREKNFNDFKIIERTNMSGLFK